MKDTLRANTEAAIARGVYGVPTFAIDEELFWGFDTTDMLLDYLKDPNMMKSAEMLRLAQLPADLRQTARHVLAIGRLKLKVLQLELLQRLEGVVCHLSFSSRFRWGGVRLLWGIGSASAHGQ